MPQIKNSFGLRLRRLVEQRGTIEYAYENLGVSRATLFNWFNRDTPPSGVLMLEKLRRYLGVEAAEFLDELDEPDSLRQAPAHYGLGMSRIQSVNSRDNAPQEPSDAQMLQYLSEALKQAKQVPGARGYIWAMLKMHLSPSQIQKLKD